MTLAIALELLGLVVMSAFAGWILGRVALRRELRHGVVLSPDQCPHCGHRQSDSEVAYAQGWEACRKAVFDFCHINRKGTR